VYIECRGRLSRSGRDARPCMLGVPVHEGGRQEVSHTCLWVGVGIAIPSASVCVCIVSVSERLALPAGEAGQAAWSWS
jgi:hypothetical protein